MMVNSRSKYGNRKVARDGMTFDSVKEYRRFCELRLLDPAKGTVMRRECALQGLPGQKPCEVRLSPTNDKVERGRRPWRK